MPSPLRSSPAIQRRFVYWIHGSTTSSFSQSPRKITCRKPLSLFETRTDLICAGSLRPLKLHFAAAQHLGKKENRAQETVAIFWWMVAHAAAEEAAGGSDIKVCYWRTLKTGGELNLQQIPTRASGTPRALFSRLWKKSLSAGCSKMARCKGGVRTNKERLLPRQRDSEEAGITKS
jgi:hypothetical protein